MEDGFDSRPFLYIKSEGKTFRGKIKSMDVSIHDLKRVVVFQNAAEDELQFILQNSVARSSRGCFFSVIILECPPARFPSLSA